MSAPLPWFSVPTGQHFAECAPWIALVTSGSDEAGSFYPWRVYHENGTAVRGVERTLEASKAAASGAIEMREIMASHPERVDAVTTSSRGRLRGDGTGAEIRVEPMSIDRERARAIVRAAMAETAKRSDWPAVRYDDEPLVEALLAVAAEERAKIDTAIAQIEDLRRVMRDFSGALRAVDVLRGERASEPPPAELKPLGEAWGEATSASDWPRRSKQGGAWD